jgi:uncharacterized membrane protein
MVTRTDRLLLLLDVLETNLHPIMIKVAVVGIVIVVD